MKKLLLVALALTTSLAFAFGDSSKYSWYYMTASVDDTIFFDPFIVNYPSDDSVEAIFIKKNKKTNRDGDPFRMRFACKDNTHSVYRETPSGDWVLTENNLPVIPGTWGEAAKNLMCGLTFGDGTKATYIASKVKSETETEMYYVESEKRKEVEYEYHPENGARYKFFVYNTNSKKLNFAFFVADCDKSKYDVKNSAENDGYQWFDVPQGPSLATYLYTKACKINKKARTMASTGADTKGASDAQSTCLDLGFKKGTKPFNTCVSKLTK